MQQCRISGCPGHYEEERKVYAARYKDQLFVIDHVPMLICDFCGDTLFTLETMRRLEQVRDNPPQPAGTIPLYEYASIATGDGSSPTTTAVAD